MSKNWREVTLGDVVENKSRRFIFEGKPEVVFINTGDVLEGNFLHQNYSKTVGLPGQAKKKIIRNDILFSEIRPKNKRYAFVDFDAPDFVVSTKFMVLHRISSEIDLKFLYILITSNQFLNQLQLIAESRSGTFPQITFDVISHLSINLPPLPEQKAIAHILGTLDDKIELNRQMNETLEAMAQALFKSWFVDFDPVIDKALAHDNEIPEALHAKAERRKAVKASGAYKTLPQDLMDLFPSSFVYSEDLGKWIPEGWEIGSLGNEYKVTMGQSPPGSTYNTENIGIPFFQGKTDFGFRFPTNRIHCTEPKRLAKINETLISVRAPVGNANLAHCKCAIGRGLAGLMHNSNSVSYTYHSVINLKPIFDVFEGEGTVFGSINQSDLKSIVIVLPHIKVISAFDLHCSSFDKLVDNNSMTITELSKTRDLLLSQLISGKTRLPSSFIEQFESEEELINNK